MDIHYFQSHPFDTAGIGDLTDLRLSVVGGDPVEGAAELLEWFRQEPVLRGLIKPAPGEPRAGELGTALDVISVAVGSGGVVSALAGSLKVFLAQRRRAEVRIVIRRPDGRQVEVDAKHIDDVAGLLRRVLGSAQ
jgi:hypothetical protein